MALRRTANARRLAGLASVLAAIGLDLTPAEARADEGFALSRFEPAPAGDRLLGVPSAFTAGRPEVRGLPLHFALITDYAHDPLLVRGASSGENLGSIVSDQLVLHLSGTVALFRRLTLNLDIPTSFQAGSAVAAGGYSFAKPSAAGFGDVRVAARVTLFGRYFDAFQLALGAMVWLPTGSRGAFAGDGRVRALPQLIAGGALARRLVWSAALGPRIRAPSPFGDVAPGSSVELRGGLGFLVDEDRVLQLGPEISASIDVHDPHARTTAAELLLAGRRRFLGDFEAGFGMGIGLAPGIGTPSFRAVGMLSWSPEALPLVPRAEAAIDDRDHDGIPDARDACPGERGPKNDNPRQHGCPRPADRDGDGVLDHEDACPDDAGRDDADPERRGCPAPSDRDGDGVPDASDACPAIAGPADDDASKNGCPPAKDSDDDGIPDASDACPTTRGVASADAAKHGCPGDGDGDGFLDADDACPKEKGPASKLPAQQGCPTKVRVEESAIRLLDPVVFDHETANVQPVSNELLDQVAAVLAEHPEILRVEVQGHTDNKGPRAEKTALSQRRAEAVASALVRRGVSEGRIVAKGYGPDRPIAANLTTEGRAKNRRVEIKIIETRGR